MASTLIMLDTMRRLLKFQVSFFLSVHFLCPICPFPVLLPVSVVHYSPCFAQLSIHHRTHSEPADEPAWPV